MSGGMLFNPPPGWPKPPASWRPPAGWTPDPKWPAAPEGWQLWLPDGLAAAVAEEPSTDVPSDDIAKPGTSESATIAFLEAENAGLRNRLSALSNSSDEYVDLNDDRVLQDVGIYRYHHPLENAALYREQLDAIQAKIAEVVKAGRAIVRSNLFTFDNSLAKGRKMSEDLGKLMLRAYNSEADNSIRSLKLGNVVTAKKRLDVTRDAIAKLGGLMEMRISDEFNALRVEEIELTADWLMKKQEEREDQREQSATLRAEQRVARELAEKRGRLTN